ncbi:unnamed protein product [Boreogadus saida]
MLPEQYSALRAEKIQDQELSVWKEILEVTDTSIIADDNREGRDINSRDETLHMRRPVADERCWNADYVPSLQKHWITAPSYRAIGFLRTILNPIEKSDDGFLTPRDVAGLLFPETSQCSHVTVETLL